MRALAAVAVLLLPTAVHADAVERAVRAGIGETEPLMAVLAEITDRTGPRLTGSEALLRAHRFAEGRFRDMGLSVRPEPFPLAKTWRRGPAWAEVRSPGEHFLQVAQVGWTPPTPGTVEGPVRIFAPRAREEMEAMRGQLKDAIVLWGEPVSNLEPLMMALPLRIQGKPNPPEKPREPWLREQIAFLKEEGAAAYLLDSGKPGGLFNMDMQPGALEADGLPGAYLIHEQFLLLRHLAPERPVVRLRLEGGLGPPATCVNTVADLVGREEPDELVVLGAHLDSWDLGTGATDNGAGAGAVIEAARLLARSRARPRRTIRFVLFSGEEQGLLGSKAYLEAHRGELEHHSAVFVMDTGAGRIDAVALQGRREVEPIMGQVLSPLRELGVVDTDLRLEDDTDHIPFDAAGIPAFCVEQVQHEYSRNHHSQADTLDKVRPEELEQAAVVLALTAYRVAQLPQKLPRRPRDPKAGGTGP
jgi:carboxypeptidase Q